MSVAGCKMALIAFAMAALVAPTTAQVQTLNDSICSSTLTINDLPEGSTTCVDLAPFCLHNIHGEYIQRRCPEVCNFCSQYQDPGSLALQGGSGGSSDTDDSSELHTAAIGLAAAIGVLLVAALGFATVSGIRRGYADGKSMTDFEIDPHNEVVSMWDDETWDVDGEGGHKGMAVKEAQKVLNENGITPSMMKEMLQIHERVTLSRTGTNASRDTAPHDYNMSRSTTNASRQDSNINTSAVSGRHKSDNRGYNIYAGTRQPSTGESPQNDEDSSQSPGQAESPESTSSPTDTPRTRQRLGSQSLSFSEIMQGNAALEESGDLETLQESPPKSAGSEGSYVSLHSMDSAQSEQSNTDTNTRPPSICLDGFEEEEPKIESRLSEIMPSSENMEPREARLGDRMGTNESAGSSFQLTVPDRLGNRQDSAFVSDYGEPDEKSKIQEEMNLKLAEQVATTMAELQRIKEESDAQINGMAAQSEMTQKEIKKLMKGKSSAEGKIAVLEEQKRQKEEEVHALRKNVAISQAEMRKLNETVKSMELQNGNMNNSLRQTQMLLGDMEAENIEIKKLLNQTVQDLADRNNEVAALRSEHAEKEIQIRESIAAATQELQILKQQQHALVTLCQTEYPKLMLGMAATKQQLISSSETAIEDATKELLARYKHECRERKLLYNHIQELRGNIRVFCRVRHDPSSTCVIRFPDQKCLGTPTDLICPNPTDATLSKRFEFDRVFNPEDDQDVVFDDTEPVITSVVDGYNVSIIAYGQTGSGKTYTMMGTEEKPGVNRRAIRELLRVCEDRTNVDYEISVSLLEIYNDNIIDLLSNDSVEDQNCQLRLDPATGHGFVSNLSWRGINTIEHVVQTLQDGEQNRSVAFTKMNSASSRSHLVLTLEVKGKDKVTGQETKGKLRMVDLAGSERNSKSQAKGQQLVEANAINKSLSALGQVFISLQQGAQHVPFRNSKLTHLLQDSLGGQSKTCFFINISPAESNLQETMSTLQFGMSIRKVLLKKDSSDSPATRRKSRRASFDTNAFVDSSTVDFQPPGSPKPGRPTRRMSDSSASPYRQRRATVDVSNFRKGNITPLKE